MSIHIRGEYIIHTNYEFPPIPYRGVDWSAVLDGYDGAPIDNETPSNDPIGQGSTEHQAIDDLLAQIQEVE